MRKTIHLTRLLVLTVRHFFTKTQGKYAEAEPLFKRALAIREAAFGPNHPDTAISVNNLALLYLDRGKYAEAEPLLKRALVIMQTTMGLKHPNTITVVHNYVDVLRKMNRQTEADALEAKGAL